MLTLSMIDRLNLQINLEQYSSNLYLQMNCPGFGGGSNS